MQDTTARGLDKGATRLQRQGSCQGVSLTLGSWLLLADLFILCSQDCGLAAPSVSGSADPMKITRMLMCFSTFYRGYILLPLIDRQQGRDTNILHAIHWVA